MKILYTPIFEPGEHHAVAVAQKRGLYNALVKAGHQVFEYDYLDRPDWQSELQLLALLYKPDLLLTQFHGADSATINMMRTLRDQYPSMKAINWSGDSHRHSLLGDAMVELSHHFDWLLVPTLDVLPDLKAAGINAGYWNIAYEEPVVPLPDAPEYDVVFLGNVFNEQRLALVEMLRGLPYRVGIYGDWAQADGYCVYDFAMQRALYQKAQIAVADNYRPDGLNYVSDRPMQIMASAGALCLHQRVEMMVELTGWVAGKHYVEWQTLDDLRAAIDYWMADEHCVTFCKMVESARRYTRYFHSFDARVERLFMEFVRSMETVEL